MLRRVVLFVLAVAVSFALTALSGYLVYANSAGKGEANLSLVVRFAISPTIAILIGIVIGFLSKDHPVLIAVLGLLPWAVMFLAGPNKPTSLSAWAGWLVPVVVYLPLAAIAAWMAWRYRYRASGGSGRLA
jgi:hypothetical protein